MKKNLLLRLCLMMSVVLTLYSCIHDEVYSSSDSVSSSNYQSKSPWKEDEKYIKNVKDVFNEYADAAYFSGKYGDVLWDYALTLGAFDETFLEVPIVKNNKINFILIAQREHDKVFFKIRDDKSLKDFFQKLVFTDRSLLKEAVINNPFNGMAKSGGCISTTITWTWTNETTGEVEYITSTTQMWCPPSGPGQIEPIGTSDCLEENCSGGGGGGGYPYPSTPKSPCENTKDVLNKPNVQQGIDAVKAQALKTLSDMKTGEIGFKEKKDGTIAPADVNSAHRVIFNDVTDSYGGYHNHTATGTHMFSPPDIDALFGFAAAQSIADGVGNAYLGMIAAEWCNTCPNNVQYIHYVIQFTGTGTELGGYVYTPAQMKQFENKYRRKVAELTNTNLNGNTYIKNSAGDLNEKGLEKLFFETLQNMNLNGKVNLQRIEANGSVNNVTLDSNGMPTGTPCP